MKEKRLLVAFLLVFIFLLSFAVSETPAEKVKKAYGCLATNVDNQKCSSFTTEQKVFTFLSLGDCRQELIDSAQKTPEAYYCFGSSASGGCDIKSTSLAILALGEMVSKNPSELESEILGEAGEWLHRQTTVQSDMNWFLQIESTNPTTCTITYSGVPYTISIDSDKKINQNAGSCLTISSGSYWLDIAKNCFDKEFEIKCNESFLTNLLYTGEDPTTIFVSESTSIANANKPTYEQINSFCFKKLGSSSALSSGSQCDYEGSLWATLALIQFKHSPKEFLPYLVSNADSSSQFLPEAFLYNIYGRDDYLNQLLSNPPFKPQGEIINEGYWQVSSDKFYDTALAMFFLKDSNVAQKEKAVNYLLKSGIQGSDGCWGSSTQTKIRDTGFLLYSIWKEQNPNYQCRSDNNCSTNQICTDRTCVTGCRNDTQCGLGKICNTTNNNNTCITGCKNSLGCPEGLFCNQSSVCAPGCYNNSGCSNGLVCLIANHTCVECLLNADCNATTEKCTIDNRCIPKAWDCETDTQCSNGLVCLTSNHTCVTCKTDAQCSSQGKVCSLTNYTCVFCEYDTHCASSGKVCKKSTNECVGCVYSADCKNSSKECNTDQNICVDKPQCTIATESTDCGSGKKCVFGYCISDIPDCDATHRCNPGYDCKNGKCLEVQECNSTTPCNPGYRCDINGKCVSIVDDPTQKEDCSVKKYFCRSRESCLNDDGVVLDKLYDCNTPYFCCDTPKKEETCADQNGRVCSQNQNCDGGRTSYTASDLVSSKGQICCVGGSCKDISLDSSTCAYYGGTCRSSCNSDETSNTDTCVNSGDICCVSSGTSGGGCTSDSDCGSGTCGSDGVCIPPTTSYLWLWILLGLIVIALVGILFRNQLRVFFMKFKSSFGGSKPKPGPGFPYSPTPSGMTMLPSRRVVLPPTQTTPVRRPMPPKNSKSDIDDVLKKLKDMGK